MKKSFIDLDAFEKFWETMHNGDGLNKRSCALGAWSAAIEAAQQQREADTEKLADHLCEGCSGIPCLPCR